MSVQGWFPVAYRSATISTTAKLLDDTGVGFSDAELARADAARITVEGAAIRDRDDGTSPTASEGHPHEIGSVFFVVTRPVLRKLSMIRRDGTDATVRVTLYSRSLS